MWGFGTMQVKLFRQEVTVNARRGLLKNCTKNTRAVNPALNKFLIDRDQVEGIILFSMEIAALASLLSKPIFTIS